MEILEKYSESLQKLIIKNYRGLIRTCRSEYDKAGMEMVRRSFDFLVKHSHEQQLIRKTHLILLARSGRNWEVMRNTKYSRTQERT